MLEAGLAAWASLPVGIPNGAGTSPLEVAAWSGHVDNVGVLVRADPEGAAGLLRSAVEGGKLRLVESLLAVCEAERPPIAARLLAAAAEALPTAAAAAARASAPHQEVVAAVVGAVTGRQLWASCEPALQAEAGMGCEPAAGVLLQEGLPEPNAADSEGLTPPTPAPEAGGAGLVRFPAEEGAAVDSSLILQAPMAGVSWGGRGNRWVGEAARFSLRYAGRLVRLE